ncbi:MAG: hypothetical protein AMXMBFR34_47650 [Myxococcaceae bacterium]
MTRRVALLSVALFAAGCGRPSSTGQPGDRPDRPQAAHAAITVAPNAVSCSTPAPRLLNSALCLCEDLHLVGRGVLVTSSDPLDAPVGVNGVTHVVGQTHFVSGLVSWGGISGTGDLTVGLDAVTPQSVSVVGTTRIGGDLVVGGDLDSVGTLEVDGLTRVSGHVSVVGSRSSLRAAGYQAPAAPPCGCDPSSFLDVAGLVAAARASNDNARIGLEGVDHVGELTLTLDGGRFFLSGLRSVGRLALTVTKPSALYIDGDLETVGDDRLSVEEGASLDLYVNGRLENVGRWTVSDSTKAGVVRLYIGGKDAMVQSVGQHDFVGAVYAPEAPVELVGDTSFRGALFAKSLSGVGELTVDYAAPAVPQAGTCPGP